MTYPEGRPSGEGPNWSSGGDGYQSVPGANPYAGSPYPEPYPNPGYPDPAAPYPAGGYGQPYAPYGAYPVARPTNGMAVASLVLGILWLYWLGSILALVFGYVARRQIRERGEGGDGMAVAGIVLGWIGVATLVVVLVAIPLLAVLGQT